MGGLLNTINMMVLLNCDYKTLFLPFEIPCNIFGVTVTSTPQCKLINLLSHVYTVLHFLVSLMLSLYRIGYIEPQFCQSNAISQSINGIQQILGLIVMVSIYYQTLFRKSDVRKMLKLLSQSDKQLLQLNSTIEQKTFRVKILIESMTVFVYAYAAYIFFAIRYNVTSFKLLVIEFVSAINPVVLTHLVLLIFVNFCWIIKNKFHILKVILRAIIRSDSQQNKEDEIWIEHNPNSCIRVVFDRIKFVAKTYETLFDTVNVLNRIFGLSNLASIGINTFNNI